MRVCLEPGCPTLTKTTRCTTHTRAKDKARGGSTQRGYGSAHQRLRAQYQARMDAGETFECWRCAELGKPHMVDPRPDQWHLGHSNEDRRVTRGPQCAASNLDTASVNRISPDA